MDSNQQFVLSALRRDIIEHSLQLKAIIQDINACVGSLAELHSLNSAGRSKISALRKFIDKFGDIAKESKDSELLKDVVLFREQLTGSMDQFRKANMGSMLTIEKNAKEELIKSKNEQTTVRHRLKHDKENLVKMNTSVTDQLLSISRQLADTTKRSADTLDSLLVSSDTVIGTKQELEVTSGTISQSGKLLAKYGRREFTDKVLMFFAFIFFVACVFYIIQKRLF